MAVNTSADSKEVEQVSLHNGIGEKACPFSLNIIHHLKNAVGDKDTTLSKINTLSGYSNKIVQLTLDGGHRIIVKQAQHDWAEPRFESARRAARLLRRHSSIIAPEHIAVSEVADNPTIAYRYLPFPTLEELWPDLNLQQKINAAKSLGGLLREMHQIEVPDYGLFHDEVSYESASSSMYRDLHDRLRPAICDYWVDMLPAVNRLLRMAESWQEDHQPAALVHNDLHLGNILCEVNNGDVQCMGLLDLEEARGGRWESDLANVATLHHPLFSREEGKGDWLHGFDWYIIEGYGKKPDPELFCFYQVYHLLNLGFFSALNNDHYHARQVGERITGLLD